MTDEPQLPIKVDVGLKAELKGEVPASSLGRLVDAVTDSIRPFTERRGLKADLLRLQREDVAIEIARRARKRIAIENAEIHAIPAKLLVPLLEKGSCEDITDDTMINRWADLLASAAMTDKVQPRFIGVLDEISRAQAECLEVIAFNEWEHFRFPYRDFCDSPAIHAEYAVRADLATFAVAPKDGDWERRVGEIAERLTGPGVLLETVLLGIGGDVYTYDTVAESGLAIEMRTSNFSILESLGLVRHVSIEIPVKDGRKSTGTLQVHYNHLTWLGVEFCNVCCRPKITELNGVDAAAAAEHENASGDD